MVVKQVDELPTNAAQAAQYLIDRKSPGYVRSLTSELDRLQRRKPLLRIRELWQLTDAELARMLGVSRQAFAKWDVPPADRAPAIAALDDATDLLERHVKRERIAAVVRRPSELTRNHSLIELAGLGQYDELLHAVRSMFDIRRIQP